VSAAVSAISGENRLLTFLFEDVCYAVPIACILEVAEKDRVTSIPSLALPIGGVMNWHGEALPLIATELLLGRDQEEAGATPFGAATTVGYAQEQVLVLAAKPGSPASLGMPVDRVIGLVDGDENADRGGVTTAGRVAKSTKGRDGDGLIVERRPIDGRIVHVLAPAVLVARGAEVVESATI
jgi:chemotaxis signal transduction protein